MKCPASCQARTVSTAPGYGLGGEDLLVAVGLGDRGADLLGLEQLDLPHRLLGVGQRDAEAALRDGLELVPVVVQRRVDVDGDAHGSQRVR